MAVGSPTVGRVMAWRGAPADVAWVGAGRAAWIRWLVPAATVAVTWVVFWPTLRNGFVSWDDLQMFPANPGYQGLGWAQLRWMWTTFHYHEYMPLTWMTYGTDYVLWGLDPAGYHLTNLLLHTVAVLAVYLLGRRLLVLGGVASKAGEPAILAVAPGVGTLLFAIHPLRAEPVAWVSARGSILGGLLLVLTTLAYVKAVDRPAGSRARRGWLTASVGLFGLALLSRLTSVMLPMVLAVLDVYPLRRLGGGPGRWLGPEARSVWREKVPFLGVALAGVPVAFLARRLSGGLTVSQALSQLADGVAVSGYGLLFYLRKTLVPRGLSPLYERPAELNPWDWPLVVSVLGVAIITGLLVAVRRRWPAGLTAWVCYVALLLPTLGLVPFGLQLVADRYSYAGCLGWTWLIGAGWAMWWGAWRSRRVGTPVWITSQGLLVALLAGFGVLSHQQVQIWRDSKTLWTHTVAVEPRAGAAHAALGAVLESEGRLQRAAHHYHEAARLWPHDGERYADLGRVLLEQGKPLDAAASLREALRRMPDSAALHAMLGLALAHGGRADEALQHHGWAVRMNPGSPIVKYHLALLCVRLGRLDEAVRHFTEALAARPGFVEAREGLDAVETRLRELRRTGGG